MSKLVICLYISMVSKRGIFRKRSKKKNFINILWFYKVIKYIYLSTSYLPYKNRMKHTLFNELQVEPIEGLNTILKKKGISVTSKNNYFFWYFFNNDAFIKICISFLMKDGKKYLTYKYLYDAFKKIKKKTHLQPILILKKLLHNNRLLFEIKNIPLHNRIVTQPTLLSIRSQITRTIQYLIQADETKKKKKTKTITNQSDMLYKFIMRLFPLPDFHYEYMLEHNISKKERPYRFKVLLEEEQETLTKNFNYLIKEQYLKKYIGRHISIKKLKKFKIKYKSATSKTKYLNNVKFEKTIMRKFQKSKYFLLNRYSTNVTSSLKVYSKWN